MEEMQRDGARIWAMTRRGFVLTVVLATAWLAPLPAAALGLATSEYILVGTGPQSSIGTSSTHAASSPG